MSTPVSPRLHAAAEYRYYASIGSDIDLQTAYPGYAVGAPARLPREIHVGGSGNLVLVDVRGISTTLPVTAGKVLPLAASRITAAGTTATQILVLW